MSVSGPYSGLRVIELAHERTAHAGKLLGDLGADVIVVEPPAGATTRSFEPYLKDEPDPEGSLHWWNYNTSKRGITLNLEAVAGRELFRALLREADILIEGERPGRMAELELDYPQIAAELPRMLYASITPFGRSGPRAHEEATDLTLLAGGGPAWSCGYDDHSLPPVRGSGNQAFHLGAHFALMSLGVALLVRHGSGKGQFIEVNLNAACNVTTEMASYEYLVAGKTVQRQTGRHATVKPSLPTQSRSGDARYVNTGIPPRNAAEFAALYGWLQDEGFIDEFPEAVFVKMGAERPYVDFFQIGVDDEVTAICSAAREAQDLLARRLSARDFFIGAQSRGLAAASINTPEEVLSDPHFQERGFPVEVEHPERNCRYTYPGAPYRFTHTPWRIQGRAPRIGEHNEEILGQIISAEALHALRLDGVV